MRKYVLALCLALGICVSAGAVPPIGPQPTPTPTPSATPVPIPTATPTPVPAPDNVPEVIRIGGATFRTWKIVMDYMNDNFPCVHKIWWYFGGSHELEEGGVEFMREWHWFAGIDVSTFDTECDAEWRYFAFGNKVGYLETREWDMVIDRLAKAGIPFVNVCEPTKRPGGNVFFWYPIYIYANQEVFDIAIEYRNNCLPNFLYCIDNEIELSQD